MLLVFWHTTTFGADYRFILAALQRVASAIAEPLVLVSHAVSPRT